MKIFYEDHCLNLIFSTKPNSCEGCCFVYWPNCYAPLILQRMCIGNKIFKQETKKDIFYEN